MLRSPSPDLWKGRWTHYSSGVTALTAQTRGLLKKAGRSLMSLLQIGDHAWILQVQTLETRISQWKGEGWRLSPQGSPHTPLSQLELELGSHLRRLDPEQEGSCARRQFSLLKNQRQTRSSGPFQLILTYAIYIPALPLKPCPSGDYSAVNECYHNSLLQTAVWSPLPLSLCFHFCEVLQFLF